MLIKSAKIPRSRARIMSLNQMAGKHWRSMLTYKKQWQVSVLRFFGYPDKPCTTYRKVIITRYGSRLMDRENWPPGFKAALDHIVRLGWLVDDSPKWADVIYVQEKCKRVDECVTIEIYEVE